MITSELFGTAPCGTSVHRYTLNGPEICVRIMDYGATVLGIDVPDIPGNVRDHRPRGKPHRGRHDHHRRHGLAHAGQRRRQQPAQRS